MSNGPKFERFYEVMIEIGVEPRLQKLVERRASRATTNKPCLEIALWWIVELSGFPNKVAMTTNEMRPRVSVGLRVNDPFPNRGSKGVNL